MKRLALAAVLLAGTAFAALPAQAASVTLGGTSWNIDSASILTLNSSVPDGNQPRNIACVICGDNQPQQPANFGYTDFKNNGGLSDIVYFSTNVVGGGNPGFDTVGTGYDGSFLRSYLAANPTPGAAGTFSIGIDLNQTNASSDQVLESFWLLNLTQHKVIAVYSPDPNTGTALHAANNGTGFPDYTLTGFDINVRPDINGNSDLRIGDQLIFLARMSDANDGPDSFFITRAIPGPLAGAGIPGLIAACGALWGLGWRRRWRNGNHLKAA